MLAVWHIRIVDHDLALADPTRGVSFLQCHLEPPVEKYVRSSMVQLMANATGNIILNIAYRATWCALVQHIINMFYNCTRS